ncbi:hypothetical protein BJF78_03800 [Pseudonocardia sp. CNS-139]|nr:hypothetical protein BJF78_03800 [Pseudonocardia sp. CNS-139]
MVRLFLPSASRTNVRASASVRPAPSTASTAAGSMRTVCRAVATSPPGPLVSRHDPLCPSSSFGVTSCL